MPRTLSRTLATVVEALELDQPTVVTMDMIAAIATRSGLRTAPRVIAGRLRGHGWLLATGHRGVWEFAPASHAGPFGHGDPGLALRVALTAAPDLEAALALTTAAWALGFADRIPTRIDIAMPDPATAPVSLVRHAHVTSYTSTLGYQQVKGLPTHRPETILAHLAARPTIVRSWDAVLEWLPELASTLDPDALAVELTGRSPADRVRAGYLLQGLRPDLTTALKGDVAGPVRFGSRKDTPLRHSSTWHVIDTLLPVDPAVLGDRT
jgi:hypothetical protein